MTVREFTSRVWYSQKIVVIKWREFDFINNNIEERDIPLKAAIERAEYVGTPHELRSVIHSRINEMLIDSYGVIDDTLIIEVH